MSPTPTHSPWPRRLFLGLAALLALDAVLLATAASIPAVRDQARRLVPTLRAAVAPHAPLAPRMISLASTDNMMSYSYADGEGDEDGLRYLYGEPSGKDEDGWSMSGTFN